MKEKIELHSYERGRTPWDRHKKWVHFELFVGEDPRGPRGGSGGVAKDATRVGHFWSFSEAVEEAKEIIARGAAVPAPGGRLEKILIGEGGR